MRLTQRKARGIIWAFWCCVAGGILVGIGQTPTGKHGWSIWPVSAHGHILLPMLMLVAWIVIGIAVVIGVAILYMNVWEATGWHRDY